MEELAEVIIRRSQEKKMRDRKRPLPPPEGPDKVAAESKPTVRQKADR